MDFFSYHSFHEERGRLGGRTKRLREEDEEERARNKGEDDDKGRNFSVRERIAWGQSRAFVVRIPSGVFHLDTPGPSQYR